MGDEKTMTSLREGALGALESERGETILASLPKEDVGKEERVKGESKYVTLSDQLLSFISEGVKKDDIKPGMDFNDIIYAAFIRGSLVERGIQIGNGQIKSTPRMIGLIEQIRKSEPVEFMVKMIAQVVLTDAQINQLEANNTKIEVVQPHQLKLYLQSHQQSLRPVARLALEKKIEMVQ